jgi:hypothetical protein
MNGFGGYGYGAGSAALVGVSGGAGGMGGAPLWDSPTALADSHMRAVAEARALLARAAACTRCATTGTPFGSEELRYLCHSTGNFYSEEASVSSNVRAYPDRPRMQVSKPVRFGAEAAYRVADAEVAIRTAINPWADAFAAPGGGGGGFESPLAGGGSPRPGQPSFRHALRRMASLGGAGGLFGDAGGDPAQGANGPQPSPGAAAGGSSSSSSAAAALGAGGQAQAGAEATKKKIAVVRGISGAIAEEDEDEDEDEDDEGGRGARDRRSPRPGSNRRRQRKYTVTSITTTDARGGEGEDGDGGGEGAADGAAAVPAVSGSPLSTGRSDGPLSGRRDSVGSADGSQSGESSGSDGSGSGGGRDDEDAEGDDLLLGPEEGGALADISDVLVPGFEPELFFGGEQTTALEAAVSLLAEARGDVALMVLGKAALARIKAAANLTAAVNALSAARPLRSRSDAAVVSAVMALRMAEQAGVGPTVRNEARLLCQCAVAETELAAAVQVCGSIAVGTHASDADIARLARALDAADIAASCVAAVQAERASAQAQHDDIAQAESAKLQQLQQQVAENMSVRTGGSGKQKSVVTTTTRRGAAAADAADVQSQVRSQLIHGSSSSNLGPAASAASGFPGAGDHTPARPPPRSLASFCSLQAVDAALVDRARVLLKRLQCEVGVMDDVAAAGKSLSAVQAAVAAHDAEDPSALPVPELSPEEQELVKQAIELFLNPPPAPKGRMAPPPKAGARPATAPEVPAGPKFPKMSRPLDINGIPLPDTPQLLALQALLVSMDRLTAAVAGARQSGADDACINTAEDTLADLRSRHEATFAAEKARVEAARLEAEKRKKKKKPAKKK